MKFRRIILDGKYSTINNRYGRILNLKLMDHLEAHEIKNNDSQTSVAVLMLSGHCRWVISGTPLHKYGNIAML